MLDAACPGDVFALPLDYVAAAIRAVATAWGVSCWSTITGIECIRDGTGEMAADENDQHNCCSSTVDVAVEDSTFTVERHAVVSRGTSSSSGGERMRRSGPWLDAVQATSGVFNTRSLGVALTTLRLHRRPRRSSSNSAMKSNLVSASTANPVVDARSSAVRTTSSARWSSTVVAR